MIDDKTSEYNCFSSGVKAILYLFRVLSNTFFNSVFLNNCSAAAGRAPNWTGRALNSSYVFRGKEASKIHPQKAQARQTEVPRSPARAIIPIALYRPQIGPLGRNMVLAPPGKKRGNKWPKNGKMGHF